MSQISLIIEHRSFYGTSKWLHENCIKIYTILVNCVDKINIKIKKKTKVQLHTHIHKCTPLSPAVITHRLIRERILKDLCLS